MRTTGKTKEVRMPVKSLPSSPSLEHLKYQARDLRNALTRGHPEALARVREFHPRFARLSDDEFRALKFSLADAQLVIAREYGFPGWPKLKRHIENSARAAAATAGPSSGFKPPAGPVELRQKWPLGACIAREMVLKQNMDIHTPGKADPAKTEMTLTSQHAYTVVAELANAGREVELQHLGFRLEVDSGGFLWRYDSARSSAADQSEIAKVFQTILRAKVRYFLDANCQIERMEGVDELANRLNLYDGARLKPGMTWDNQALDKVLNRILTGRQPLDYAAWGLKRMFNENYFKDRLDPSFLPGKAVQPGDSWTVSREPRKSKRSFLNVSILREFTVTFQSWEMHADRLCARLEFRGTEKTCPQTGPETAGTVHPVTEGTFSGVAWFDPELGRGMEVNVAHDFTVTSNKIALPASPGVIPKPLMQAVTDHHHQVVTEKLVSVKGPGGSS